MEKKKFTADKIPLLVAMACVAGLVIGYEFIREAKQDIATSSPTPQVIPLPLLLKQGAGKNPHVTATGLQVGQTYVTYTHKSTMSNAFYLVTPTVAKGGKPNFCVLADLSFDAERRQFDIPGARQLTGFYQPQIPWSNLGDKAAQLIRDNYPTVDLQHCAYLDIRPYHGEEDLAKGWKWVKVSGFVLVGCIGMIVALERRARLR